MTHERSADERILEGIVTTVNNDGSPHVSPMGPIVDEAISRLRLRPYQTSTTFGNLRRLGEGVFHVTDDVGLLARSAVNRLDPFPKCEPATCVRGFILPEACRWYAFRVETLDDRYDRANIMAKVVGHRRLRDFFGFNRAKHAVVEAAILATRLRWLPRETVLSELADLAVLVEKTAAEQERRAFAFLAEFVHEHLESARPAKIVEQPTGS